MKKARPPRGEALEACLDQLTNTPRPELIKSWQALYGAELPKGMSTPLLIRAVAYRMQVKATRGLKPRSRSELRKMAARLTCDQSSDLPLARPFIADLQPGARLMREWNGRTHMVEVIEDGFLWAGDHYKSLSAVAHAITGARWSGPRFFGLTP